MWKQVLLKLIIDYLKKYAEKQLTCNLVGKDASTDVEKGEAWYEYAELIEKDDPDYVAPTEEDPGHKYRVIRAIRYDCEINGKKYHICVPVGFITDLASVPKFLWRIFPPNGTYAIPAIIHDYCTSTHLYPFAECDSIFYHAMKWLKPFTARRTRIIFYYAVRIWGEDRVYSKHTKESIEENRKFSGTCRIDIAEKKQLPQCEHHTKGLCDLAKGSNNADI